MSRHLLAILVVLLLVSLAAVSSRDEPLFASSAQPARLHVSARSASALNLEWARGRVNPDLSGKLGDLVMDGKLVVSHFGVEPGGLVNASFVVPSIMPGRHEIEAVIGSQHVLTSSFIVANHPPRKSSSVSVHIFGKQVIARSTMSTGATLVQHTVDPWGNPAAVKRGRALLAASTTFQNQSTYGWGTLNPEPRRGHFAWASLDQRIQMMRSMHAKIALTLCCAPDWMTSLGTNTSKYTLLAPTAKHYGDFAQLAKRIAERYPDVHYFSVWNELKGFWDYKTNNWNYVAYTKFYNRVYDALKSVNPHIQVGGPYIELEGSGTNLGHWSQEPAITDRNMKTILYWLHHAHGADFITLDRTAKAVHDPLRYTPALVLQYTAQFEAIAHEIHAVTNIPIWWVEERFQGGQWNFQTVGLASIMYYELLGGSGVSLTWEPQGKPNNSHHGNYQNLFSDTRVPGGGKPYPYYYAFLDFHRYFGPGTPLLRTQVSSSDVEVLASPTHVLLINTRPRKVTIHLGSRTFAMAGYTVKTVDR